MKKDIPLDLMEIGDLTKIFMDYTEKTFVAVKNAIPDINEAIQIVIDAVKNGGRVFYVGAGTSGRIGVLDASEIEPTFSRSDIFIPVMAGGVEAIFKAKENLEDDENLGKSDLMKYNLRSSDVVVGISASGKTPYVMGALKFANETGCKTILISNSDVNYNFVNKVIILNTGDEFIIGSTRLSAGTSQKIVLNMISTITMVKLGYTYGNLMVAVKPTNKKLVERASNIVSKITGVPFEEAFKVVNEVRDARIASLMIKKKIGKEEAENLLKSHNYNFRSAYES